MPFEGLARSISQEYEASAALERRRSALSTNSKIARANNVQRPHPVFEESHRRESAHSGETLTDGHDLEANKANHLNSEGGGEGEKSKQASSHAEEEEDPYLVTIKGRDHLNPHTWNETYRWAITAFAGLLVLNATFASSAPSNLIPSIIADFGVSQEVGVLLIAIFVAGYCVGPLLWGPLSERYGRKIVMISAWIPYFGFQIGCALAPNIGSLIVFRFLGGCFAAAPLTNSGGVIADLWGPDQRGDALAIFSLMPFAGPAMAPIISGAMQVTGTDWTYIFWVLTAFAGVCFLGIVFILPETYVPYLMHKEAKRLRKETGDSRWYSAMDNKQESAKDVVNRTVLKPFRMIVEEPMLLVMTLYMSFVYGIIYLLFEAVPIIFVEEHGLNALEGGLVFLALLTGGVIGVLGYILYFNKDYKRKHHSLNGKSVPPEYRLRPLMFAAPFFAASFFIIGFTSYPKITIAAPIIGIVLLGTCVLFIFLSIFNYIIDTYLANAASALAINTVARSSFGAGFPLFANQMFAKLTTPGAAALLGGLAIVFTPVPFLLYKYGKKIRSMSKNAVVRADE